MDCDGPKHVLLHDLDGTLTGLGPDASVTARSEFMSELRADETKFTCTTSLKCSTTLHRSTIQVILATIWRV